MNEIRIKISGFFYEAVKVHGETKNLINAIRLLFLFNFKNKF